MNPVTHIFEAYRYRELRQQRLDEHLRGVKQERAAVTVLYPRTYGHCSGSVPQAWAGVHPLLLAEFQQGDYSPEDAA